MSQQNGTIAPWHTGLPEGVMAGLGTAIVGGLAGLALGGNNTVLGALTIATSQVATVGAVAGVMNVKRDHYNAAQARINTTDVALEGKVQTTKQTLAHA